MSYDQNLHFLTEKIATLKTAILNDLNSFNECYVYPCLIKAEHVDSNGQLWFLMDCGKGKAKCFETPKPVRLQFFANGENFRLDITGMASLPADNDKVDPVVKRSMVSSGGSFPVKIKITQAEYADVKTPQSSTNVFSMLYYKFLNRTTQLLIF